MTQPNNYVLKGGASNQVSASLVRIFSWNRASIIYVSSSIKVNFSQLASVNLKPRKRCVFWIDVDMLFQIVTLSLGICSELRLPYLLLIRNWLAFLHVKHEKGLCPPSTLRTITQQVQNQRPRRPRLPVSSPLSVYASHLLPKYELLNFANKPNSQIFNLFCVMAKGWKSTGEIWPFSTIWRLHVSCHIINQSARRSAAGVHLGSTHTETRRCAQILHSDSKYT
jgi:hypothetical protein